MRLELKHTDFLIFHLNWSGILAGTVTLLKIKDEKIQFPSEKKFGLMAADTDSLLLKTGFSNYVLDKKCRIDMGTRKKRKDRLIKDFYIATRKE